MNAQSAPPLPLALLLVDLQPSFLQVIPEGQSILRRAQFAAETAKILGISVAITEQVPEKLGPTANELTESAPEAPVFSKTAFSALGADGLIQWLKDRNVQHLLIAGIETPVCIYQTAVQAMAESFDVTLLTDAIGERRIGDRDPAMNTLRHAGAHMLPSETVFYSILGDAQHPQFKAYTQLVKQFG
ncbi:MAG: isochorismatase family protein [Verrucomicrobiota bacterium]